MKFSIIVPTFNSENTIKTNIESIIKQTYKNYEIIIIDNCSTDKTLNTINEYSIKNINIIKEKDSGIYNAFNKGIKISSGEIISHLNSDDFYYNEKVLESVLNAFNNNFVDIIYGNLLYVKKLHISKVTRFWKAKPFKPGLFYKGWSPPHPSFFSKRILFDKYGLYDENIGTIADIKLMYNLLEKNKIKSFFLDQNLIKMREGGASNKSIFKIIQQNINLINFFKSTGSDFKVFNYLLFKIINRIIQILKAKLFK